jgi:hypothetical protein
MNRLSSLRRIIFSVPATTVVLAALLSGCLDEAGDEPEPAALEEEGSVHTVTIATPEGTRTVTYEIVDGQRIVDGDIVLAGPTKGDSDGDVDKAAPRVGNRWPGGVVPYEIDPNLPNQQRVHDAITHYQRRTAVRLVPRNGQGDYIRFVPSTVCTSSVGRNGGAQTINLAPGCGTGATIHEIAHALGLWHEQSRHDRNAFIDIHWQNIPDDKEHNFQQQTIDGNANYGPYDYGSIMHYDSFAFSSNGQATITRKDGSLISANQTALSDGDLRAFASMYPAPATVAPSMCRTAPPRGALGLGKRADVAEIWEDVGPAASIALHASTGSSFSPFFNWATRDGGFSVDNVRWNAGDFDGDGDQDLAAVWNHGGLNTLTVRRSNGWWLGHEHWAIQQGGWMASTQWLPGDFNGDGKTDLAAAWNDAGAVSIAVYRSNGNGFDYHQQWVIKEGGWGDNVKWNVGDFNGDGRDDILNVWNYGGFNTLTVRLSTGSGFAAQQHWAIQVGGWMDSSNWVTGDFDGNGKSDVATIWNDGGLVTLGVFASNGSTFGYPNAWAIKDGGWGDNVRWAGGDFNADGKTDLVSVWNDGGMSTLTVRQSTGSAFSHVHWGIRRAGWQDQASWCAGSFDAQ